MITFFRYSGTKANPLYIDKINEFVNSCTNEIYVEPFVGSGGIFFNLEKSFQHYILSDLDSNIIRIYKSFKEMKSYSQYIEIYTEVFNKFGTLLIDNRYCDQKQAEELKRSYYEFRAWFNQNYWKTDTFEEGVYLHLLTNSCLNSFLRFGPNGMNQSYGLRCYLLSQTNFNVINSKLQKCDLICSDYQSIINDNPTALFFLDPPYQSQDSSYTPFDENDLKEFIKKIKPIEFIYTDILNNINSTLKHKLYLRNINSTSPNRKETETKNEEFLFTYKEFPKNGLLSFIEDNEI